MYFLFSRFIACIETYLHAKLKNNLSGEVCKIDKPPSFPIKTLKNMTPGKDGKPQSVQSSSQFKSSWWPKGFFVPPAKTGTVTWEQLVAMFFPLNEL